MNKVLTFIAALTVMAGMLTSCDKHAFSISSNEYRCVLPDGSVTEVKTNKTYEINKGQTLYFYASGSDGHRLTGGTYSPKAEDDNARIISARVGSYNGESCIEVTGKESGLASVQLNFTWRGFTLYKSASIKVNE